MKTLVACLSTLLLTACGSDSKPAGVDVVGAWEVDVDRVRQDFVRSIDSMVAVAEEKDKPTFEQRKQERLKSLETFRLTLEISADNTFSSELASDDHNQRSKGNWKKVQGGWRLSSTHEDGAPTATRTMTLRMEGQQLVGGETPELTLYFNRRD